MNANARKWIEALRGGEYAQTRHTLRDERGFCCLGVGCDLYGLATQTPWQKDIGGFSFDGEDDQLPDRVSRWLGLNDTSGAYGEDGGISALIWENDNGRSSDDIASLIESALAGLFESPPE